MTRFIQRFTSSGIAFLLIGLAVPTNVFAVFIPGLDDVAVGTSGGTIYALKSNNFSDTFNNTGFGNVTGIQVTSGNLVLASNNTGDLRLRASDLSTVIADTNFGNDITTLGLRADDVAFIAGDLSGSAGRVALVNGGGYTANSPQGGFGTHGPNSVGFQSNGDVALGNLSGDLRIRSGTDIDTGIVGAAIDPIAALAVQSNDRVVVGTTGGSMQLYNGATLALITNEGGFGAIVELRVLANDNIVVATNNGGDGRLLIRTGTTIDGVADMSFTGELISAIALQSNGNIVAGFSSGRIRLLQDNGAGGFNVLQDEGGFGPITDLAVFHAIPEPTAFFLMILGVVGMAGVRRRAMLRG